MQLDFFQHAFHLSDEIFFNLYFLRILYKVFMFAYFKLFVIQLGEKTFFKKCVFMSVQFGYNF